ncbi:E3 ubiquitin-protein ligase TRIM11-like isoform X2 [Conger conger]|uniref:E3 ubiquitin-protein ligase TRIM11-like isoform X2 n=1 Tax=Conger conger TaxID=82655 RepID=UPI002A5A29F6|nr:E3 ubiquitin-protein ligase TRIM11-like isoform X2 [Conger conger]
MVEEVSVLEPLTRKHFLQYGCQLTLDPNTAFRNLCLSEGNREVTRVEEIQSYPDHPERFERWAQVLCREDGCQLTLDPNTAHRYLCLSEGNREVTRVGEIRSYPDHPERFEPYLQVLCREELSDGDGNLVELEEKVPIQSSPQDGAIKPGIQGPYNRGRKYKVNDQTRGAERLLSSQKNYLKSDHLLSNQ